MVKEPAGQRDFGVAGDEGDPVSDGMAGPAPKEPKEGRAEAVGVGGPPVSGPFSPSSDA